MPVGGWEGWRDGGSRRVQRVTDFVSKRVLVGRLMERMTRGFVEREYTVKKAQERAGTG